MDVYCSYDTARYAFMFGIATVLGLTGCHVIACMGWRFDFDYENSLSGCGEEECTTQATGY